MGGRGASFDLNSGEYGKQYETIIQFSNIKFIRKKKGNATPPLETKTKGRVYATVNNKNQIAFISYYDKNNKKTKVIDVLKKHKKMIPHTHHGYFHNENDNAKGATALTTEEKSLLDDINKKWYSYLGGKL